MDDPGFARNPFWATRRKFLGGLAGLSAAGALGGRAFGKAGDASPTPCTDAVINVKNQLFHIVLRDYTNKVSDGDMDTLVSVIGTQLTRDFSPIWGIRASVSKSIPGTPTPTGAWQVKIQPGISDGGHAVEEKVPWAEVPYEDNLDLLTHFVSHETLEMLANPFQSKFHLLDAPREAAIQELVLYPHEICDPCQSLAAGYNIDCRTVSDFVLPSYFEPFPSQDANPRYSFAGGVTQPRTPMLLGLQKYRLVTVGDSWVYDHPTSGLMTKKA